jgi:NACHT conflict system protein
MPFSDKSTATIDALELLPKPVQPWRLRGLLSALAHSPCPEAEEILTSLPHKYADFLGEYDWLRALEKRGTVVAARTLLGFIFEGAYANKPGGVDAWTLYRKLAGAMRMDSDFRAEVYQRYERDTCGAGSEILEMAIAEAADEVGVLLLVRNYARRGKPFPGALLTAIQQVAVAQRPSEDWGGATVSFSVDVTGLRRELFRMISGQTPEASLAKECLNAIDELRDEHGAPESEPRHPDIESGQPWPIVR